MMLAALVTVTVLLVFDLGNTRWWHRQARRRWRGPVGNDEIPRRRSQNPEVWLRRLPTRSRRVDHDLVARRSLESLARAIRAGDSLTHALAQAIQREPDLAPWFGQAVRRCERGVPLIRALPRSLGADWPAGMGLVHRALLVAAREGVTGRGAQRALLLSAGMVADRQAVRAERAAQSAQARLSATVLTWVPLGVALLSATADARVRYVLLHTSLGWSCLVFGTGLAIGGQYWIQRLIQGGAT
jgi:Flp pilus assembly protein TadB